MGQQKRAAEPGGLKNNQRKSKEPSAKTGRPSSFSQAVADAICEGLVAGKSLRAICRDEDTPSVSMVCRWLAANEAFREQYAHAREAQADALVDEILEIADDARNDWMERQGEGESAAWRENGEAIRRSVLRVDARKWLAGKLRPKKYGDKLQQEISGGDGKPVSFTVQWLSPGQDGTEPRN